MKMKKRKKSKRMRGSHTHSRGAKKKARGSGHRGGVGLAGSGKRGDQKKTLITKLYGHSYFGKSKTLRRGTSKEKLKTINLSEIIAKGLKSPIELKGYKVLSRGEVSEKLVIKASAASQSAIDKVKKLGGDILIS